MAELKWKGYVLLESLFAMAIIMTSFTICMMTFSAMTESQRNYLVIKSQIALDTEAARCKTEMLWIDEDIPEMEFVLQRRVRVDEQQPHVAILEIKAITHDGKILSEYYELVYVK